GGVLWGGSPERVAGASSGSLIERVNREHGAGLPGRGSDGPAAYADLHRWSIRHPGEFWAAVWDHAGVPGERGERLLVTGPELADTRFLPDARLNVGRALLPRDDDTPALLFAAEDGETDAVTWAGLRTRVAGIQQALRADGVGPGDRVAAMVSNRPEAYALMIATASLGAVSPSVPPDFGPSGVLDRFAQVPPAVLVGVARYAYAGKEIDCTPTLAEVAAGLPGLRRAVLIGDPPAAPP